MTRGENGTPETPEWTCEARPFKCAKPATRMIGESNELAVCDDHARETAALLGLGRPKCNLAPGCQVCESDQQAIWRHGSDATIPPNVSLGEE